MKFVSFLIFVLFAFLPMMFFTSCQQGFRGFGSGGASNSSVVQLSPSQFIGQFCDQENSLLSNVQSKTSRFRAFAKVHLENLDDSNIEVVEGVDHYNINITVNNSCLMITQSGFTHKYLLKSRNPELDIQSYMYLFPVAGDLDQLANDLLKDSCVLRASPNQKIEYFTHTEGNFTFPATNDSYVGQQKHLKTIELLEGFSHLYNPTLGMNVLDSAKDVIVAIVDTGLDTSHPDLVDNYWSFTVTNSDSSVDGPYYGVDAVSLDRQIQSYTDYNVYDEDGHGTHVAGLLGAVPNNSIGTLGVSPYRTQIMGIKVFRYDSSLQKNIAYATAFFNGARWARDRGAKVINFSIGSKPFYSQQFNPDWEILFSELLADGVTSVLATGNSTGAVGASELDNENFSILPAIYGYYYKGVINVGATQAESKMLASYSHYGKDFVEIAAPGSQINGGTSNSGLYSTSPTYRSLSFGNSTSGYSSLPGTSQAAPQVAGAVAQVYSYIQEKTGDWPSPCEVEAIIQYSAEKVDSLKDYIKDGNHLNIHNLGITLEKLYP